MPIDSDDLERRQKLEAWQKEQPSIDRLMLRVGALEARCYHLEHDRAKGVQQERVGGLENRSQVRYAPVDDRCDKDSPDVPTPVGTEAFRREMASHMDELAAHYRLLGHQLLIYDAGLIVTLERLAGVACTLRDAYDLARIGEHEAAQEKLEEIEW